MLNLKCLGLFEMALIYLFLNVQSLWLFESLINSLKSSFIYEDNLLASRYNLYPRAWSSEIRQ